MDMTTQELQRHLDKTIELAKELFLTPEPPPHHQKIEKVRQKISDLKFESETGGIHAYKEHFNRMFACMSEDGNPTFPEINHPQPEITALLNTYRDRLYDMEEGCIVRFDYHLAIRLLLAGWDFARAKTLIAEVNEKNHVGKSEEYFFYANLVIKTVYKQPEVRQAMQVMAHWKIDNGISLKETNLKRLKISLYQ